MGEKHEFSEYSDNNVPRVLEKFGFFAIYGEK